MTGRSVVHRTKSVLGVFELHSRDADMPIIHRMLMHFEDASDIHPMQG
jgi:hypothetical protein